MDYKEKYENGVECIQEILSGGADSIRISTLRKRLQPFFPELQENKGERIKKVLIDYFNEYKEQVEGCGIYTFNGMQTDDILAWLEKQGEKKHADKVEPKFKIRDFIVNDYCKGKVIEITNDAYLLDTGQGIPFSCEHNAHLWTIQDAEDGDVLVEDSCIFIIQKLCDNSTAAKTYCTLHIDGDFDDGSILYFDIDSTKPATQEQRDLLFQAMKEAGYEWDSKKKELKKI